MHSKIFKCFLLECIQGTKVTLVLRVQRRTLFLSMSTIYPYVSFDLPKSCILVYEATRNVLTIDLRLAFTQAINDA